MTPRRIALKPLAPLMLATALFSSGCAVTSPGSGGDYRTIFSDVIRKSLAQGKANNVCLPSTLGFTEKGPDAVEVNLESDGKAIPPMSRLGELMALESVGLLARTDSERTVGSRVVRSASFKRTATGATFFSGSTFCYARAELDSVVKWKGPVVLGEYRAAWVYYTTKTSNLATWASAPAVLAAFPAIAPWVRGDTPKTLQVAIDLSNEGWDIAEYSKLLQVQ